MKAIFDDRQWNHRPKHFMANGAILPNPEQAERIDRLTAGSEGGRLPVREACGCRHRPDRRAALARIPDFP